MDNVKDKAIYGVLAVILVVTSLTLFLQMHGMFKASNSIPYAPDVTVVPSVTPKPEESPLLRNKNLSRPLEGSVVMLAEDGSYLRLGVTEEGVLSVGVTSDTVITLSGTVITLQEIPPFAEALLEVIPLEDSQMYDFLAVSVDITASPDLTSDDGVEQAQQSVELINN